MSFELSVWMTSPQLLRVVLTDKLYSPSLIRYEHFHMGTYRFSLNISRTREEALRHSTAKRESATEVIINAWRPSNLGSCRTSGVVKKVDKSFASQVQLNSRFQSMRFEKNAALPSPNWSILRIKQRLWIGRSIRLRLKLTIFCLFQLLVFVSGGINDELAVSIFGRIR